MAYDMEYDRGGDLLQLMRRRIVVLDGAMGTMIRQRRLPESEVRGGRFASWHCRLWDCCDVLALTRPDIVAGIHGAYIDAGADVITTNSLGANTISLKTYGLECYVAEINHEAAKLARTVADHAASRHWVAGSVGPVPAPCNVSHDELVAAYACQMVALIDGGVDVLLVETIFDARDAQIALAAARVAMAQTGITVPVMISFTLNADGRLYSGESIDAVVPMLGALPVCICLNCGYGVEPMIKWIARLSGISPVAVGAYPNAGLPNAKGEYGVTPEVMASQLALVIDSRMVNMVGGCCGTTPAHIASIAAIAAAGRPRSY